MDYRFLFGSIIVFLCVIIILTQLYSRPIIYEIEGGDISPLADPVDMLQMPQQFLSDGYRFQNSMFPPEEINKRHVTYCDPIDRQRVGVFKDKAYIDQEGGHEGASIATVAQMKSRADQDKYLTGKTGDPIEDSEKPFGKWVQYGPPEVKREVNYPNRVFSWGDVMYRYKGEFSI